MQEKAENNLSLLAKSKELFLPSHLQFCVFDTNAILLDADRGFIDLSSYINKSVFNISPFMESIFPVILELKELEGVAFPRIENFFLDEAEILYDFYFYKFKKENNSEAHIAWLIESRHDYNIHLSKIQQERNNLILDLHYKKKNL